MFFISLVSHNPQWGLVLNDYNGEFFTYKEAKDEVDRIYKESPSDRKYGVAVAAFIMSKTNEGIELVYSSVSENAVNHGFTCPVCNKQQAKPSQADFGPIAGKWFVYCDTCYSRTGFYDTENEAIEAWYRLTGKEG